ncbi:regulator of chromosome condensation 1/beta-lactamase-inhibitor protein II [Gloeopeniophorella convolvens]|nr:regulator of chromosome condensation 1/beta-lactamase-inhibitor protein II [Gloeopeniophorella convolvens]
MFGRHARDAFTQPLRRQFTRQSGTQRVPSTLLGVTALATSVAVAVTVQQLTTERIYNDTPSHSSTPTTTGRQIAPQAKIEEEGLRLLVWGTNRSHIISPDAAGADQTRTPSEVSFLQDVALRDLAVHTSHAACIDARGDVYQWGDGFFGTTSAQSQREPILTLRGKNIVRVQVTESRVFALSASGKVYAVSAQAAEQILMPGSPTPSSAPWWGTGWLWGEEAGVRHSEITPTQPLTWGEKIVSISAGRDHLLALTSSGRTFAHPISKNANTHGQLGLRKFDIPDPSSSTPTSRLHVELTPRAVVDPYAKSSRYARQTSSSGPTLSPISENLVSVDDRVINFSDRFFEVPALRGVHVVQIAAGSRSSFVRTDNGRVLGWGANDYGQIGLGGSVALDTITVPTEVVLWRSTPNGARTQCIDLNVGGDLAFFTVERVDGTSIRSIDVLSCGNGQFGGLGHALFSNAQSVPVRTKAVSGLLEFSEKTNNLQPITPQAVSISPDGHVLLTLDTHARAGPGGSGRDLLAWGTNYDYQVGNGRRASIAVPTTLECADGSRLMLNKRRAAVVRDPQGRVWRRGVDVEQVAVAGHGHSLIYWRIC